KIIYSLFLLFFIVLGSTASATIWRVNNTPGSYNYTSGNAATGTIFQQPHQAVSNASVIAADSLYIERSATSTEGVALTTKQLIIIGPGYFLDPEDAAYPGNTGLQASVHTSTLNNVTLGAEAAGSKFIGIHFTGTFNFGAANNNILVERCLFITGNVIMNNGN